jgi:hypothetical protein
MCLNLCPLPFHIISKKNISKQLIPPLLLLPPQHTSTPRTLLLLRRMIAAAWLSISLSVSLPSPFSVLFVMRDGAALMRWRE